MPTSKTIILIVIALFPLVVIMLAVWSALVISGRKTPEPGGDGNEGPVLGRNDPAPVRRAMEAHRRAYPYCFACGAGPVEIHHIIPVSVDPDGAADPGNLISLCPNCHIVHGHAGDTSCRHYVQNICEVLRIRKVRKI